MSVLKLSERQQRSEQRKKDLLTAAVKLFKEHGISAVGVRDIAETAGVTTGTFYHYFKSKMEIVMEVHELIGPDFFSILSEAAGQPNPRQALIDFFTQTLAKQCVADGLDFTQYRLLVLAKHSGPNSDLYRGCVELVSNAQQAGQLTNTVSAEAITDYLFIVHRGVLYEWCVRSGDFDLVDAMTPAIECALRPFAPCFYPQ